MTKTELLLHEKTRKSVSAVLKAPPQGLLIYGPSGSGKQALAEFLAAELLGTSTEKLADQPYFISIEKPENKQEIPIESVREMIKKLGLRAVIGSHKPVKRLVLIDSAHLMSLEAQNALLKVVEEPPAGTVFLLTAQSDSAVLPTIASRLVKMSVLPVTLAQSNAFYKDSYDSKAINSAWQLSGGAAGLMDALLKDDDAHPLKQAVESAKKFLSLNRYERLLFADQLTGSKDSFADIIDALSRIVTALHHSAVKTGSQSQAKKLLAARKQLDSSVSSFLKNTSPRLIALDLAIRLPI